ncbi:hypothetical protein BDF14DRAFT_1824615 [Spinellus fusiger]|nr:hypothetical protein BDF14DRAFT_1824615 [Spinellus fusiger]
MTLFTPQWSYTITRPLAPCPPDQRIVYSQPLPTTTVHTAPGVPGSVLTSVKDHLFYSSIIDNTTLELRCLTETRPVVHIEYHCTLLSVLCFTLEPVLVCWLMTMDGRLIYQPLPDTLWENTMTACTVLHTVKSLHYTLPTAFTVSPQGLVTVTALDGQLIHLQYKPKQLPTHVEIVHKDSHWCEYKILHKHSFWPLTVLQSLGTWIHWKDSKDEQTHSHTMALASNSSNSNSASSFSGEVTVSIRNDTLYLERMSASGSSQYETVLPWLQDGELHYPPQEDTLPLPGGYTSTVFIRPECQQYRLAHWNNTWIVYSALGHGFFVYTQKDSASYLEMTQLLECTAATEDQLVDMTATGCEDGSVIQLATLWHLHGHSVIRTATWNTKTLEMPQWSTSLYAKDTAFSVIHYHQQSIVVAAAEKVGSPCALDLLEAAYLYHTYPKESSVTESLVVESFSSLLKESIYVEMEPLLRQPLSSQALEQWKDRLQTRYTRPDVGPPCPSSFKATVETVCHHLTTTTTTRHSKIAWDAGSIESTRVALGLRRDLLITLLSQVECEALLSLEQAYAAIVWLTEQTDSLPCAVTALQPYSGSVASLLPTHFRLPVDVCVQIQPHAPQLAQQLADRFLEPTMASDCSLTPEELEFLAVRHLHACIPDRLADAVETLLAMAPGETQDTCRNAWLDAAYEAQEYSLISRAKVSLEGRQGKGSGRLSWEELVFAQAALCHDYHKANQVMHSYIKTTRTDPCLVSFFDMGDGL